MNDENTQTVSAETVANPPEELDLAEPTELDEDALLAEANMGVQEAQGYLQGVEQDEQRYSAENVALMRELGGEEAFRQLQSEQLGLNAARDRATELNKQVLAQPLIGASKLLQSEQDVIGSGVTRSLLGRRLSNRERDNAIESLVLSAQANIAAGNVEIAERRVEQAVKAKYEPVRRELEIAQFNLERVDRALTRGDMKLNKAEQKQFDLQKSKIQEQRDDLNRAEQMTTTILKNRPPAHIRRALVEARTVGEINAIPGIQNYLMSDAEKLDLAYKRAQIAKINADLGSPAEITAQTRQASKDKLDLITSINSNKRGLASRVGTVFTGRGAASSILRALPGGGLLIPKGEGETGGAILSGEAQRFSADVKRLMSKETLDNLIDIKSQGATFGNLSDGERLEVSQAASTLAGYADYDKNGNFTGKFNASEDDIAVEIERLQRNAELSYVRSGGELTPDMLIADEYADQILQTDSYGNIILPTSGESTNQEFFGS